MRVKEVEIYQTPDRLSLRNKNARLFLPLVGCVLFVWTLLSPLIDMISPSGLGGPQPFWSHVTYLYLHGAWVLVFASIGSAVDLGLLWWLVYERHMHRGFFAFDRRTGTVQAGGGVFCLLTELEHVLVRKMGVSCGVYLIRASGGEATNWGGFGGLRVPRNACFVVAFWRKEDAEDVAGIISEFADVSVRHQAAKK